MVYYVKLMEMEMVWYNGDGILCQVDGNGNGMI